MSAGTVLCEPLLRAHRGAWAFLIGSYLQLLETLNKHPTAKSTVDLVKEGKPQNGSALSNGHKDEPETRSTAVRLASRTDR